MSPHRSDDVLRLLVVDDDEGDRRTIRRHLANANLPAQVDELSSAADVVEKARAEDYDCIILDHFRPGESGAEILGQLTALGVTTPVLIIAAHDDDVGTDLVAAGAADVLTKDDLSSGRLARRLRSAQKLARAEHRELLARREADAQRQLLQQVLQQLPTGVVVVDPAHSVLMSNRLAEVVFGPHAQGLLELEVPRGAANEVPLQQAREVLDAALGGDVNAAAMAPIDHHSRRYRVAAAPVLGKGGKVDVAVLTLDDVTDELSALAAAERAARARQELLSVVSHDLRGPLSAIQVALDGLSDETVTGAERARYAAAVTRSVQRAERLVRDLLVAAQLEAGTLRMELSRVSARALMEQAFRDHELEVVKAKIALVLGPIEELELHIDRERILQALANLIQNALRHARGTPDITLEVRRPGPVELITRDRGPGVALDAHAHLFEPFWQGSERRGGTGLGLSIVRGIARAHGGDALVRPAPGGGAEFVISLPG
jgi:signal transduction histidine kinase